MTDIDPKALALRVAAKVCHKDQMVVWSSEVAEALQDFISDDLDYSDIVSLHSAIEREIRDIVKCALEHPETERALAAFLREAAEGWRDIASAPKDGTWILAWRGPAQNGSVWTNPVAVRWFEFEEDEDGAWCWPDSIYEVMSDDGKDRANSLLVEGECYDDNTNFTHWRPLPAPPS